jgi:hypothetical protein
MAHQAVVGSRFELLDIPAWTALREIVPPGGYCMIGLTVGDRPYAQAEMARLVLARPDIRALVLLEGSASEGRVAQGRRHPMPSTMEHLLVPDELRSVPRRLAAVWLAACGVVLLRRIDILNYLPHPLKTFLTAVLELQLQSSASGDAVGWSASPRVTALCARAKVPRSQVYLQAKRLRLRPTEMTDAWRSVQIVATRNLAALSWAEIEHLAGYSSSSGLSDLLLRGLGKRPGALATEDAEYWIRWFATSRLAPLWMGGGDRDSLDTRRASLEG